MDGNVVGLFLGKECADSPQRPLGFAMVLNMWNVVRCFAPNSLHRHPQPLLAIDFGFVTTSILDNQAHGFFGAFSSLFFMWIDGAEWPLPLQCFPRVFGLGFSFHGPSFLCQFCDYELFWGFWVWSRKV